MYPINARLFCDFLQQNVELDALPTARLQRYDDLSMSSDVETSANALRSSPLLHYSTDTAAKGRRTILHHPDGIEVILRRPLTLPELIAGGIVAALFALLALVPATARLMWTPTTQIPWWVRAIFSLTAAVVIFQVRRSWVKSLRPARIDCRAGRLYFTWSKGRDFQTFQIDWNRIYDLYAGESGKDEPEGYTYLGIIDAAKEEQELLIDWLSRAEALHLGRLLRRTIGLPPNRQDAADFDEDCTLTDRA